MIHRKKDQSGVALVYSLMMVLVFTTLIALTFQLTNKSLTESSQELYNAQAVNASRSGIQDAFGWFTRQANIVKSAGACVAPVGVNQGYFSDMSFAPVGRTTFTDIADSDNGAIGIVRDILLDDMTNLYAHYEVRKQIKNNECGPNAVTNEEPLAIHDITHLKNVDLARGSGSVWRITSVGYVYRRGDRGLNSIGIYTDACCENMPATTKNKLLSKKILSAEFNRLNLTDPLAAITILDGTKVVSGDTRSIIAPGSTYGVKVKSGALSANVISIIKGAGTLSTDTSLDLSSVKLFGMTSDILKGVSDTNTVAVTTALTHNDDGSFRRHASKLIFIDNPSSSDAVFDITKPLKGTGILFVKSNLVFESNSLSFFSGVIYVENGNVTIKSGNTISGAIIVAGSGKTLTFSSPSGDVATVEYNREIIDAVRKKLANYRLNRLSFKVVQ